MIEVERLRAIAAAVMKHAEEFGESQGFNHAVYEWLLSREEYVMAQAMPALLAVFEAAVEWRDDIAADLSGDPCFTRLEQALTVVVDSARLK